MSDSDERAWTAFRRRWRQASGTVRLSGAMLVSSLVLLLIGLAVLAVAAWTRFWHGGLAIEVVVDGAVLLLLIGVLARLAQNAGEMLDPAWDESPETLPHSGAVLLALTLLPWIGVAGVLGADLSTRPELYEQISQIIPVLLLTLTVERRFFDVRKLREPDRAGVREGFFVLILGAIVAEFAALLAVASGVGWIEVLATVLASSAIPGMLVLASGTVLVGLYPPAPPSSPRRSSSPPA
jgi:hypothetical protein